MKFKIYKDFTKKYSLINNTMVESELQKVYNYKIHPRDSIIPSNKRFVKIDDGRMGGSHWTCFIIKDNKSYYFV